jgi:ATP-dependent Clp protease ATP-binding subunit ClpC
MVDFKNTVIIMTTNLGTRDISKGLRMGFSREGDAAGTYDRMKNKVQEELKGHFRPEFLNRVDDIIVFHQLLKEEIFRIVDLMIAKVDDRLKDRDMAIELRPDAKDLLSVRGYDPVLGARPLRRTIQREIEDSLSEKILFGELRPGQIVIVDVEGSGETAKFTFNGVPKPEVVPEIASEPEDTKEPVDTHDSAISSSAGSTGARDGGTASALG